MENTSISIGLIKAYQNTEYQFSSEKGLGRLYIDSHCQDLESLMRSNEYDSACFISAFNPFSVERSQVDNFKANEELRKEISALGLTYHDGIGVDPSGEWEGEPSFLIMGISRTESMRLGNKYGQNAIVWIDSRAIPKLILLR